MTRLKLQPHEGKRLRFTGILRDFRTHSSDYYRLMRTAAVEDIRFEEGGQYLCDHVWVQHSEALEEVGPAPGDRLSFEAVVNQYRKQDKHSGAQKIDWSLSNPTDVKLVNKAGQPMKPHDECATAGDTSETVKVVYQAVHLAGGWHNLRTLIDVLETGPMSCVEY